MTPRALFVQFTGRPSGSPISGLMVVEALREAGYQVHAVFHQMGELVAQYERRGCSVEQIRHAQWLAGGPWHRRLRRLIADLRTAGRFAVRLRELRPNLVYVNNLTGLAAVLAAKRCGIPCVWHLRELLDDVGGEMHSPWPGGKPLVRRWVRR
ncbi:MAG: glycosyltransferase, partial [Thermogutta sp.]